VRETITLEDHSDCSHKVTEFLAKDSKCPVCGKKLELSHEAVDGFKIEKRSCSDPGCGWFEKRGHREH